jgi:hypothetical protein
MRFLYPDSRPPQQHYFEDSQASPACPSDKTSTKTKMNVVHWYSDTDREKRKRQEKTPCYGVTVSTRGIRWRPDPRIQPNYPMSDTPLATVEREERGALPDATVTVISAGRT